MSENKYPIGGYAYDSDARAQAPTFDEMVGMIEKLFKNYLGMAKAFTAADIEERWQHYKATKHLWQDESRPAGAVWVKASERVPIHDYPLPVKFNGEYQFGNFYEYDEGGGISFYYSWGGMNGTGISGDAFERLYWLDEQATGNDAVDPDELWDKYSEYIDDDIDSLSRWAGSVVITKENFKKLLEKLKNK